MPLAIVQSLLDSMSVSEVAQHRHLVVRKRERYILQLLGAKDGSDLTEFNIGSVAQPSGA